MIKTIHLNLKPFSQFQHFFKNDISTFWKYVCQKSIQKLQRKNKVYFDFKFCPTATTIRIQTFVLEFDSDQNKFSLNGWIWSLYLCPQIALKNISTHISDFQKLLSILPQFCFKMDKKLVFCAIYVLFTRLRIFSACRIDFRTMIRVQFTQLRFQLATNF